MLGCAFRVLQVLASIGGLENDRMISKARFVLTKVLQMVNLILRQHVQPKLADSLIWHGQKALFDKP